MLHARITCKDMENKMRCLWPKEKKTKIIQPDYYIGKWELLPTVILHDIYSLLPVKDRINASSTCRTWRQSLYHPSFWKEFTFKIYPSKLNRARYFTTTIGRIVTHATIKINSLSVNCMNEFMLLLQQLKRNDNLLTLILEPSFSHMKLPIKYVDAKDKEMPVAQHILNICSRRPLQRLSLGMNEELLHHIPQYLKLLAGNRPEKVTMLGLASLKDDPSGYYVVSCDWALLSHFSNLRILSTDYDALSDSFLDSLKPAKHLERLVIHVHGIWEGHIGTTEEAWSDFTKHHPKCGVRVTLLHAYDEVCDPNIPFLKRNMRLTHFRALFCEDINIHILDVLSSFYEKTLRSIKWVDSMFNQRIMWKLTAPFARNNLRDNAPDGPNPDPLVILAWLCTELEEITLIGYKYAEEDLVAIARLRADTLKKLDITGPDIVYSRPRNVNAKKEISRILGKQWQPLSSTELHPVIQDPTTGDSNEFITPYLLADLR